MSDKNNDWENTCERYVCFLDIMGFKDLVARNVHEEVLKKITTFFDSIKTLRDAMITGLNSEKYNKDIIGIDFRIITFSDSILIVTKNCSKNFLKILLIYIQVVINQSIKFKLPIKGVVTKGKVTADFNKNIFFGQPIIDAYQLQDELKYYGVIISSHLEKVIIHNKELNQKEINFLTFRSKTPLKCGKIDYLNLSFYKDISIEKLKELYYTVDGSPRIYVDNTIEMFNEYKNLDKNK